MKAGEFRKQEWGSLRNRKFLDRGRRCAQINQFATGTLDRPRKARCVLKSRLKRLNAPILPPLRLAQPAQCIKIRRSVTPGLDLFNGGQQLRQLIVIPNLSATARSPLNNLKRCWENRMRKC